jgi:acyl-[acyl-carrier-protein]-phospholipid O-acyltransferase/long-chain-fatty-acid--[acyl-carrier-protein] ligase
MNSLKALLRWALSRLYHTEVVGMEHYHAAGNRVLVVANHTSFLDAALLWAFLPGDLTFAIDTHVAQRRWVKPLLRFARVFAMDPTNPLSTKALIRYLEQDRKAVIFPEGRITVTGALMKVYDGPGMIADHSCATVLPIRIDGAQYTPFSRLRGRVRLRWFPTIRLNILPARHIRPGEHVEGRERRKVAGRMLADLMTEMMFISTDFRKTLFAALIDAQNIHGSRHIIVEDIERRPLRYRPLIMRSLIVGAMLEPRSSPGEHVGVLLPNAVVTVATFLGLSAYGRVPAMLNYTLGSQSLTLACEAAMVRTIITSRRFVQAAKLEQTIASLAERLNVAYLEDLAKTLTGIDKLKGLVRAWNADGWYSRRNLVQPDDPAVVLFTSGSEGTPKGVVLSHANLLANRAQLSARIDYGAHDVILNALPLFHSFGLTAGTLLPLFSGMRTFFYPSPLHYRIVPEIAYDINATILFGTNTFLTGYARYAHPYDFYSIRYVFAGAERVQDDTRRIWAQKFGLRILEGYGTTETGPVLSMNTPMDNAAGSVGRLLPGIDYRLEPIPGIAEGGRLYVIGPNIMRGYLLHDRPGILVPPTAAFGAGWYDTGDIVTIDVAGFIRIQGRAKRFAKVAGEMVSLSAVEELAAACWPGAQHAAVVLPDPKKGEQVILATDAKAAERSALYAYARTQGIGEILVPKILLVMPKLPLLATGKIDYPALTEQVRTELAL